MYLNTWKRRIFVLITAFHMLITIAAWGPTCLAAPIKETIIAEGTFLTIKGLQYDYINEKLYFLEKQGSNYKLKHISRSEIDPVNTIKIKELDADVVIPLNVQFRDVILKPGENKLTMYASALFGNVFYIVEIKNMDGTPKVIINKRENFYAGYLALGRSSGDVYTAKWNKLYRLSTNPDSNTEAQVIFNLNDRADLFPNRESLYGVQIDKNEQYAYIAASNLVVIDIRTGALVKVLRRCTGKIMDWADDSETVLYACGSKNDIRRVPLNGMFSPCDFLSIGSNPDSTSDIPGFAVARHPTDNGADLFVIKVHGQYRSKRSIIRIEIPDYPPNVFESVGLVPVENIDGDGYATLDSSAFPKLYDAAFGNALDIYGNLEILYDLIQKKVIAGYALKISSGLDSEDEERVPSPSSTDENPLITIEKKDGQYQASHMERPGLLHCWNSNQFGQRPPYHKGTFTLKIVLYNGHGEDVTDRILAPWQTSLKLKIDNSQVGAYLEILGLTRPGSGNCNVVSYENNTLSCKVRVSGFLREYRLDVIYGGTLKEIESKHHADHVFGGGTTLQWPANGNQFEFRKSWEVKTNGCHTFRLLALKRVINGYRFITQKETYVSKNIKLLEDQP